MPRSARSHLVRRLPFAAGVLFGACMLPAQAGLDWRPAPVFPARQEHAMAYDLARGRTVLFGGTWIQGNAPADDEAFGHTFEWDGTSWVRRRPPRSPTARHGAALAYDIARQRTVLFGGRLGLAGLDETWEWDGLDWSRRTPAVHPGPGTWAMAYDVARARMVLHGNGVAGAETWEWDGRTWLRRLPTNNPSLQALTLAYDVARGVTVVVGQRVVRETWEWNGSNWVQRVSATQPDLGCQLAYDVARQRVLAFGGHTASGGVSASTFDWDGAQWTARAPTAAIPARRWHAMAYDHARQRVVVAGGSIDRSRLEATQADTWEWDGSAWSERANGPAAAFAPAMAYDSDRGVATLLVTPYHLAGGSGNETWEWRGADWTLRQSGVGFGASSTMAYDRARRRSIVLGGAQGNDTWLWDGAQWQQATATSRPAARSSTALAYDAARARVVMFGGRTAAGGVLGDTYEWDGTTWLAPQPARSPSARHSFMLAHDEGRGQTVLFGGYDGNWRDDTWLWDGMNWTPAQPAVRPAAGGMLMAYDPRRQRVVLVSGSLLGNLQTWEWDGTTWAPVVTATTLPLLAMAASYDAERGQILMFGQGPTARRVQTWLYGPGTPALAQAFGSGCGSSPPLFGRLGSDEPTLGNRALRLEILGAAASAPAVIGIAGAARVQRIIGQCDLYLASPILSVPTTTNPFGMAQVGLPIPVLAALRGTTLFAQGFIADGRVVAGIVFTDGRRLVIGD